ncbi:hypothetical protein [Hymenobacter sp.]|uniref:hypothetical protein n=1 Tax=Hymenobacter sp. TaxID=1898978 RepID=UPI002869F2AE|nr:hypothetical protein [Hymenobacter sp.]
MKNAFLLLVLCVLLLIARASRAQSIGIGTLGPRARAAPDGQSPANNTGRLIPRPPAGTGSPPRGVLGYQAAAARATTLLAA